MRLRSMLIALCTAALGACGGGGGGSAQAGWSVSGTVVDSAGDPVSDAIITVPLEEATHTARTDAGGRYQLTLPQKGSYPSFFTGSVEKPGMVPQPVFFEYDSGKITWNAETTMDPVRGNDVVFPSTARVTHLGDSNYSGSVNSQFQFRYATGTVASESIVFDAGRRASYTRLCISLYAKGINPWSDANRTSIALIRQGATGSAVVRRLAPTSDDGSYSALRECFPLAPYAADSVLDLQVRAGYDGSDYDDFEFIGLTAAFE